MLIRVLHGMHAREKIRLAFLGVTTPTRPLSPLAFPSADTRPPPKAAAPHTAGHPGHHHHSPRAAGTYTDTYKKTIGVDFLEKEQYVASVGQRITYMVGATQTGKTLPSSRGEAPEEPTALSRRRRPPPPPPLRRCRRERGAW